MPKNLELILLVILICAIGNVKSNGGITIRPEEFPFLVAITDKNHKVRCSGTLITDKKVLSSNKCFPGDLTNVFVEAGSVNLYCELTVSSRQVRSIYHVVRNPEYINREMQAASMAYDIVVVTVKSPFNRTNHVYPINLASGELKPGSKVIVASFGAFRVYTMIDGQPRYVNSRITHEEEKPILNKDREYISTIDRGPSFIPLQDGDMGGPLVSLYSTKHDLYGIHTGKYIGGKEQTAFGIHANLAYETNREFVVKHLNTHSNRKLPSMRRSGQNTIIDGKHGYFLILSMYLI